MKPLAPFFIIGTQRGGTTLLRLMLNSHPQVGVPPESHFLLPIVQRFGQKKQLDKRDQEEIYHLILNEGRFDTWNINQHDLLKIFQELPENTSLKEIIHSVFIAEVHTSDKSYWGDKTPEYLDIFEQLGHIFPKAKMVFLVRDGRDVVQSLADRGWQGWSVYQRSKYWLKGILKMHQYAKQFPKRSLMVSYEALVKDAPGTLQKICSFLDFPYQSEMLEYHLQANQHITTAEKQNRIHTKLGRLPKPSDLQKWKTTQSTSKIFYTEAIIRNGLAKTGYELSLFRPLNPIHQIKKIAYVFLAQILQAIYRVYHFLLGEGLRNRIRASVFGGILKRIVNRA